MEENYIALTYKDKQIYLIKTAHVSKNSVEDVKRYYEEIQPDTIAIELDSKRYENITNKDKWRNTDIVKVIKDKEVGFLLANVILSSYQRRMAKSLNSNTGGEMIEGIRLSKENNLELALIDRPIKTTFARIWSKLDFKEKTNLLVGIIESIFDDEEISEEELDKLKEADALEEALAEVSTKFPMVKHVLVDERDMYLSQKIKETKGNKVMAIIGAAHANGIVKHINEDINTKELEVIKPKSTTSKLSKWILPIIVVAMLIYIILSNKDTGLEQLKSWIIWNGGMSALGVALCFGHPLSILTAFLTGPITSFIPVLRPGLFAGLVEAIIRKPKVRDFEDIYEDTSSIKGFLKNRVTRTLLIVIVGNLFSLIGKYVSGISIIKTFFASFR